MAGTSFCSLGFMKSRQDREQVPGRSVKNTDYLLEVVGGFVSLVQTCARNHGGRANGDLPLADTIPLPLHYEIHYIHICSITVYIM
jgi:hypothetical protein